MGWSTVAVAVGILGEYIAHFVFTKEKKSKAEWVCTVMFALLVIGGISGEWWYGKQLSETADSLKRIADGEVAAANQKASEADARAKSAEASVKGHDQQIADDQARIKTAEATVSSANASVHDAVAKVATADTRIAEAQSEAADAKKETAQFNEIAERERLARVQLEKHLQPRMIDAVGREAIAKTVRALAPSLSDKTIKVLSVMNDQEGTVAALIIIDILARAKIKHDTTGVGRATIFGEGSVGIRITGPTEAGPFIDTLGRELRDRMSTWVDGEWDSVKYKDVTIGVGAKPVVGLPRVVPCAPSKTCPEIQP